MDLMTIILVLSMNALQFSSKATARFIKFSCRTAPAYLRDACMHGYARTMLVVLLLLAPVANL